MSTIILVLPPGIEPGCLVLQTSAMTTFAKAACCCIKYLMDLHNDQEYKKNIILAMYSGGLDSLGMVYKLLTEPEYADYRVHVHHIHITNIENRHKAEAKTVHAALQTLAKRGYDFGYSESSITSPTYQVGENMLAFMYDWDVVRFFAGWISSVNPEICKIAIGRVQEDLGADMQAKVNVGAQIIPLYTDAEVIFPMTSMDKGQVYATLPDWLQDKFWSCRTPVYQDNKITRCHKCKTCQELDKFDIGGLGVN